MSKFKVYRSCSSLIVVIDLWNHKGLELELEYSSQWYRYFSLRFCWSRRQDHAGLTFSAGILGLSLDVNLRDSRHWNAKAGRWFLSGEEFQHQDGGP